MNFTTTAEAIRTYFLAQWILTAYAAVPIYQANRMVSAQLPDSRWIRMTIIPGERAPVAYGNTRNWRTFGQIVFQIFVPKGDGDGNARRYADAIGTILEGKNISGVWIESAKFKPDIGDEVNWAQFNVVLDYTVDELK